jgi:hypothetical protein
MAKRSGLSVAHNGVIAWELKAARSHGILADRLNARLADYIAGRVT